MPDAGHLDVVKDCRHPSEKRPSCCYCWMNDVAFVRKDRKSDEDGNRRHPWTVMTVLDGREKDLQNGEWMVLLRCWTNHENS